jgi:hypothetical protein
MKMRRLVFAVKHANHDSIEGGDDRHEQVLAWMLLEAA